MNLENVKVGDRMFRITFGGVSTYVCPVDVVKVTTKQFVVRTPRGREFRHWKKDGREVGASGGMTGALCGPKHPEVDGRRVHWSRLAAAGETAQ